MLAAGTKQVYDLKRHGDVRLSEHLKVKDFRSYSSSKKKLYSNEVIIYTGLPEALEKLMAYLGANKITIVNGYRCPEHNAAVGGSKKSMHLLGLAADVKLFKDSKAISGKDICLVAEKLGFAGIGYMQNNSVHLDVSPSRIWRGDETKKENGAYYSLIKHKLAFEKYFKTSTPQPAVAKSDKSEVKYMVEERRILFDGKDLDVTAINHDGENYMKMKDLEKMGFRVSAAGSMPIVAMDMIKCRINGKEKDIRGINTGGRTYTYLRETTEALEKKVGWEKGIVIID